VETEILGPVSPLDQFTVQPEQTLSAVSTTDSPEQIVVGPEAEIVVAAGVASVVTRMALEIGLSPQTLLKLLLNVTVYEPFVETVTLGPVSPLDQFTVQSGHTSSTVSMTDSPGQSVVVPEAPMIGAAGAVLVVTSIALEVGLSPQMLLTVAV